MIPAGDNLVRRTVPFVNYLLIAANILMFFVELTKGEHFILSYGAIPLHLSHPFQYPLAFTTLFTAMFLHGGWAHLIGNMIYLAVFGDNIEDTIGHFRYLIFYLVGGLLASLTHVIIAPNSAIPMVGASGAIAAVLGAYLIFFPAAQIRVIFIFFFLIRITYLPSLLILGFWFILQLFSGVGTFGAASGGGVAYWAHIGGFVAGVILALKFRNKRRHSHKYYSDLEDYYHSRRTNIF